jgi:hypothetical protein
VHAAQTPISRREDEAAQGAAVGVVTGGVAGAAGGALAAAPISGVRPILAGGFLAGILAGTVGGAALGGWISPFMAKGVSEQDAHHYDNELKAGRTLVIVKPEGRHAGVAQVLHDPGGR